MRLLQISNYYYPHIGGIEQVARDIADSVANKGNIEQKVICFNEDADDGSLVCNRKETVTDTINNVEIVRCGCQCKVASQSISAAYKKKLKDVFESFNPDVVILHYPNPFVSFFLLKMLKPGVRFILYWHLDITKQKILGKLFHTQTLRLLQRADTVVATSPNYIDGSHYLLKFRDKCIVIPNCVREERLSLSAHSLEKSREIREKYGNKTICFAVGRHVPYKGMEYIVKASSLVDDSFVFIIGGKGELTDSLKQMASGDSKIHFIGRIPDDEMASYYSACDIFAFPSVTKNEAFGIALAEAMCFSKPCVTFTIPGSGVNYVSVNGETGIECPNADYKAFAEALKKLQTDKDLYNKFARNAGQRVHDKFMFNEFAKNIDRLFDL